MADHQWKPTGAFMVFRDKEDLEEIRRHRTEQAIIKQQSGDRLTAREVQASNKLRTRPDYEGPER